MVAKTILSILIALASHAWPAIAWAQSTPAAAQRIAAAKLIDDVDLLQRMFEAVHPGLYRYNTKPQMAAHFAKLRAQFQRDRTLAEAYIEISRFLATIKCGHTYANFFNQQKDVAQALFAGRNRVPFTFRWIDGRMIVTRELAPEITLVPGSEILSINGIAVADIFAQLMTIARADGSNDAKRTAYLEVTGTSRYEAFDIFLPLFYPTIGDRLDLLVRMPGAASPISMTVAAQSDADRKATAAASKEPQRGEAEPLWRFERLDDRTTILRMPSWALFNSKWDWSSFLEQGFDDLVRQRVAGLILDLRQNEGGQDIGNTIIARIAPREIRNRRYRAFTRYRAFPKEFDPYLDTWDWSFKDWGQAAREDRDGFFRMTKFDDDEQGDTIKPRGRRYEGRVIVLVGPTNSSATFQFSQLVKDQGLATLVGRTTGGNQRGINGSAFFFVTLPNSRIEVDLPLVASFPGTGPWPTGAEIPFPTIPDAGIEPDVTVLARIDEVARGIDSELEAARALLSKMSTAQP